MNWTHRICEDCWNERNPDRIATKIIPMYARVEECCFCHKDTASGIYIRHNPKELNCKCEEAVK